jgi:hypothetical protein
MLLLETAVINDTELNAYFRVQAYSQNRWLAGR